MLTFKKMSAGVASVLLCMKTPIFGTRRSKLDHLTVYRHYNDDSQSVQLRKHGHNSLMSTLTAGIQFKPMTLQMTPLLRSVLSELLYRTRKG
jgi:hypothetical protein